MSASSRPLANNTHAVDNSEKQTMGENIYNSVLGAKEPAAAAWDAACRVPQWVTENGANPIMMSSVLMLMAACMLCIKEMAKYETRLGNISTKMIYKLLKPMIRQMEINSRCFRLMIWERTTRANCAQESPPIIRLSVTG